VDRGFTAEKVVQVPFGADLSMFQPQRKLDAVFRVLFVGAVSLQKGVPYLLDAVRRIGAKREIQLWLVGPIADDMRLLLKQHAHLFEYKGVIARRSLAWYYSQASVLVLPSIQEGMALVQAQALACGVPIIGTEHSGAADLITDGVEGFVVPIRDADAIAERLVTLQEEPALRESMAAAALQRLRTIGGWDTYADCMCRHYRSWLNELRCPACVSC
jgi:glycosyltransferase involved in cell wall biosynthesis